MADSPIGCQLVHMLASLHGDQLHRRYIHMLLAWLQFEHFRVFLGT